MESSRSGGPLAGMRGAARRIVDSASYKSMGNGSHEIHRAAKYNKSTRFGSECTGKVGAGSNIEAAELLGVNGARYEIGSKVDACRLSWQSAGHLSIGSESSVRGLRSVSEAPLVIGEQVKANSLSRLNSGPTTILDGGRSINMTHTGSGALVNGGDASDTVHASSGFMNILPGAEFVDSALMRGSNVIVMPGAKVKNAHVTGGGTTVFCRDAKSDGGSFDTPKGFISIIKGDIGNAHCSGSVIFPVERDMATLEERPEEGTRYLKYREQHSDVSVEEALSMDWSALPAEQREWVKNALSAVLVAGEDCDTLALSCSLDDPLSVTGSRNREWLSTRFAEHQARATQSDTREDTSSGPAI